MTDDGRAGIAFLAWLIAMLLGSGSAALVAGLGFLYFNHARQKGRT